MANLWSNAPADLSGLSTPALLETYGRLLAELRHERGVLRTNNPPSGDYGEWLVKEALGGSLEANSAKSHDITHPTHGRIQVKARVVSQPERPGQRQTSPFRSWDFDTAALILFDDFYLVRQAVLIPRETIEPLSTWRANVNGSIVRMTNPLMSHVSAIDITRGLRAAAARDRPGGPPEPSVHQVPVSP